MNVNTENNAGKTPINLADVHNNIFFSSSIATSFAVRCNHQQNLIDKSQKDIDTLEKHIKGLAQQQTKTVLTPDNLQDLIQENQQLNENIDALYKESSQQEAQLKNTMDQNSSKQQKYADQSSEIADLQAQIKENEQKIEKLLSDKDTRNDCETIESLEKQIQEKERENKSLSDTIAQEKNSQITTQEQIEAYQQQIEKKSTTTQTTAEKTAPQKQADQQTSETLDTATETSYNDKNIFHVLQKTLTSSKAFVFGGVSLLAIIAAIRCNLIPSIIWT